MLAAPLSEWLALIFTVCLLVAFANLRFQSYSVSSLAGCGSLEPSRLPTRGSWGFTGFVCSWQEHPASGLKETGSFSSFPRPASWIRLVTPLNNSPRPANYIQLAGAKIANHQLFGITRCAVVFANAVTARSGKDLPQSTNIQPLPTRGPHCQSRCNAACPL